MAITTSKPHAAGRPWDAIALSGVHTASIRMEDLGAGADITARAFFRAKYPIEWLEAEILPEAVSAGIDSGNTLVVTLRNITAAVDIATLTQTTDLAANTPVALTLSTTAANLKSAADDVMGIVVTQGATANAPIFWLQGTYAIDDI